MSVYPRYDNRVWAANAPRPMGVSPASAAGAATVYENARNVAAYAYNRYIGDRMEEETKGYARPNASGKRKVQQKKTALKKVKTRKAMAFKKAISRTGGGGGGGRYGPRRRVPMRRRKKGYVAPAVKRFVRRSARALDLKKEMYGKVNTKREINTGHIEETSYNVAKYSYLYTNEASTMESYLNTGIRRLAFNAAHTAVTSQLHKVDYDVTNRPHGEYGMKIAGGYKKLMVRNNDLIDINVDIMLFKCVENTDQPLNNLFIEGVEQKHFADETNENSPLLHILQYQQYFADDWVQQKQYRKIVCLKPGEQVNFIFPLLKGEFDSTYYNKHKSSMTYSKGCTQCIVIRSVGSICHDTTNDSLVGYSKHTLDWVWHRELRWRAKQPVDQKKQVLTESLDTITNGEAAGEDDAMDQPR